MSAKDKEPRFQFVHIPKTGGNTIRRLKLQPELEIGDFCTETTTKEYQKQRNQFIKKMGMHANIFHDRLQDLTIKAETVFAVVRNPWDRVASMYRFRRKLCKKDNQISFEDFVDSLNKEPFYWLTASFGRFSCIDYLRNNRGIKFETLMFENLVSEIRRFFDYDDVIGWQKKTNPGKPYTEYYSGRTKKIVADWYKDDIETFGFEYGAQITGV